MLTVSVKVLSSTLLERSSLRIRLVTRRGVLAIMDFKTLVKQIFDKMGIEGEIAPEDGGYFIDLVDPFDREQSIFIREGINAGSLEIYATIAKASQDQSILMRVALKQNLLNFRQCQNMVGIDEPTESIILCGRFDSTNSERLAFSEWLDEFMLELQQYHELSEELSRSTLAKSNPADTTDSAYLSMKV